jgi:hypothetical protein
MLMIKHTGIQVYIILLMCMFYNHAYIAYRHFYILPVSVQNTVHWPIQFMIIIVAKNDDGIPVLRRYDFVSFDLRAFIQE